MRTAIDAAGRLVVAKAPELHARDGALVIEPLQTPVTLTCERKRMVAVPAVRLPELTLDEVRAALEGSRR